MGRPGMLKETPELLALLTKVNSEINKYPYKTDKVRHKELDYWSALLDIHKSGDCDDYALTKRKKLIEAGISHEALIPVVCNVDREGHMVLVVRTDKRDLVLDNIQKRVVPVSNLNYQWLYKLHGNRWVECKSPG